MQNLMYKKVIAAIIINNERKILIAQRAKKDALFGKWEFPGGKMELGETEHECLKREMREEFGIEIQIGNYLTSSFFKHNNFNYEMRTYFVTSIHGQINLYDHQAIRWVYLEELVNFDMPDPDKPIVDALIMSMTTKNI